MGSPTHGGGAIGSEELLKKIEMDKSYIMLMLLRQI
jgi:hypothetical protein